MSCPPAAFAHWLEYRASPRVGTPRTLYVVDAESVLSRLSVDSKMIEKDVASMSRGHAVYGGAIVHRRLTLRWLHLHTGILTVAEAFALDPELVHSAVGSGGFVDGGKGLP